VPARRPTKSSLSSEPGRHHAPVPTISGNTLVLEPNRLGGDATLSKPYGSNALLQAVRKALRTRR